MSKSKRSHSEVLAAVERVQKALLDAFIPLSGEDTPEEATRLIAAVEMILDLLPDAFAGRLDAVRINQAHMNALLQLSTETLNERVVFLAEAVDRAADQFREGDEKRRNWAIDTLCKIASRFGAPTHDEVRAMLANHVEVLPRKKPARGEWSTGTIVKHLTRNTPGLKSVPQLVGQRRTRSGSPKSKQRG